MLTRHWRLLCLGAALGTMLGLALVSGLPARYRATTTLIVVPQAGAPYPPLSMPVAKTLLTDPAIVSQTLSEAGLSNAWTAESFIDGAVLTEVVPASNVLKLHVVLRDRDAAVRASTLLARKATELSRRIDSEAQLAASKSFQVQIAAAERALRQAEGDVIAFKIDSQLERVEAEIRAAAARPASSAVQPALDQRRAAFYRLQLEARRRESEYESRLRALTELRAREERARDVPAGSAQLQVLIPAGSPPEIVPKPRLRIALLAAMIGIVLSVVAALAFEFRANAPALSS